MIYTVSKITIQNYNSKLDRKILLYQGDKNIEIQFEIVGNNFKQYKINGTNLIEDMNASYGQLIIQRENANPIITPITETKNGKIIFTINGTDIDQLEELGIYTFQIRLYNEDMSSRVTLPPCIDGIEVLEGIITE